MEMHDVSCCVWMLWKDAKYPDAVFKLTWLTILGVFAVSEGAWGLLGDVAVKPNSKDCPVKGALSTSFAFSTGKFFSVFFVFGESMCLLQLQNQIFKLSVTWNKFPLQFLSIKSKWSYIVLPLPQWYVSWLESAHKTNSFVFTGKKKQPNKNPKGWLSATSTSANYWLVLLTCSCTFIHIIHCCLSKAWWSHDSQTKMHYTRDVIYSVQEKKPNLTTKVACGVSLDFAKCTCQLSLAQVICEGREISMEIKISVRLAFTQMILQPFLS